MVLHFRQPVQTAHWVDLIFRQAGRNGRYLRLAAITCRATSVRFPPDAGFLLCARLHAHESP
jgi:hypothetical protein